MSTKPSNPSNVQGSLVSKLEHGKGESAVSVSGSFTKQKSPPILDLQGLGSTGKIELPDGGPDDREQYIEYALDMVVHNLISSGQLDPSKAYLLKTPEMRAHIGRMCDKVSKARSKIDGSRIASHFSSRNNTKSAFGSGGGGTRWALQPNALPITIITDKYPEGNGTPTHKTLFNPHSQQNKPKSKLTPKISEKAKGTKLFAIPIKNAVKFNRIPSRAPAIQTEAKHIIPRMPPSETILGPSVLLNSIQDGSLPMTQVPTMAPPNKPTPPAKHNHKKDPSPKPAKATAQAFRVKLDMRGFNNQEISLDLDGRKLTVTGIRPKRDELNARKATEAVEIPEGINVDSLKIARQSDGILLIEETVPDTETIL